MKKGAENMATLEKKINDNLTDVTKRLSASANDLTLDDLNSARIAIARIDALTDIEKHMTELEHARAERRTAAGGAGSMGEVPQIPSTAFAAPGFNNGAQAVMASAVTPVNMAPPVADELPQPRPISNVVINRITGVDGHYAASISASGGPTKTVHIGDKISGGTVTHITAKTVEIEQNGTLHEYQIKGVDKVYGRSL